MKRSKFTALVILSAALGCAFASADGSDGACSWGPVTKTGLLTVDCSVLIPAQSSETQRIHFTVGPDGPDNQNGLAVVGLDIPGKSYAYTIQAYNMAGSCASVGPQQLRLELIYNPPFCNPPELGQPEQCQGSGDPTPIGDNAEKEPIDGAVLQIHAMSSELQVHCTGKFRQQSVLLVGTNARATVLRPFKSDNLAVDSSDSGCSVGHEVCGSCGGPTYPGVECCHCE